MDAKELISRLLGGEKLKKKEKLALLQSTMCQDLQDGQRIWEKYQISLSEMNPRDLDTVFEIVKGGQEMGFAARIDEAKLEQILDEQKGRKKK